MSWGYVVLTGKKIFKKQVLSLKWMLIISGLTTLALLISFIAPIIFSARIASEITPTLQGISNVYFFSIFSLYLLGPSLAYALKKKYKYALISSLSLLLLVILVLGFWISGIWYRGAVLLNNTYQQQKYLISQRFSKSRLIVGEPLPDLSKKTIDGRLKEKYEDTNFYHDNNVASIPRYKAMSGPLGNLLYSGDIDPQTKNWYVGYPLCTNSRDQAEAWTLQAGFAMKISKKPLSKDNIIVRAENKYYYQTSVSVPKDLYFYGQDTGYTSRVGKCNMIDQTKFVNCKYESSGKLDCANNGWPNSFTNTYVGTLMVRPLTLNEVHRDIQYLAASSGTIVGSVVSSYTEEFDKGYKQIIYSVLFPIDPGFTPGPDPSTVFEQVFLINKDTGEVKETSRAIESLYLD